jgi:hypothetical protein
VEDTIWVFAQQSRRLELRRQETEEGVFLTVTGDGPPRSYFFRDLSALVAFQSDMETFLLKTGWSFEAFTPERRSGRDRRLFPRVDNDRRRWWTDGTVAVPTPRDGSGSKTGS